MHIKMHTSVSVFLRLGTESNHDCVIKSQQVYYKILLITLATLIQNDESRRDYFSSFCVCLLVWNKVIWQYSPMFVYSGSYFSRGYKMGEMWMPSLMCEKWFALKFLGYFSLNHLEEIPAITFLVTYVLWMHAIHLFKETF